MEEGAGQDKAEVQTVKQELQNVTDASPQGATAEDAERAKAEKKAEATQLMDDMEASAETQGQYFVKIGQKKPITETREKTTGLFKKTTTPYEETVGYEDERALILKAPVAHDVYGTQREDFVVATPDGLHVMGYYRSEIDNPQSGNAKRNKAEYDFLVALTKGGKVPGPYSGFVRESKATWMKDYLKFSGDTEDDFRSSFFQLKKGGVDIGSVFQESVQKSIAMIESPHKANIDREAADKNVIANSRNIISSLPPRA